MSDCAINAIQSLSNEFTINRNNQRSLASFASFGGKHALCALIRMPHFKPNERILPNERMHDEQHYAGPFCRSSGIRYRSLVSFTLRETVGPELCSQLVVSELQLPISAEKRSSLTDSICDKTAKAIVAPRGMQHRETNNVGRC